MDYVELDSVLEQAQRIRAAHVHADADGAVSGYFTPNGDFVICKPQRRGEFGPPMPIGIVSRAVMG